MRPSKIIGQMMLETFLGGGGVGSFGGDGRGSGDPGCGGEGGGGGGEGPFGGLGAADARRAKGRRVRKCILDAMQRTKQQKGQQKIKADLILMHFLRFSINTAWLIATH